MSFLNAQDTQLLRSADYETYLRDGALIVLNKSDQASAEESAAIKTALAASLPNQLHVISCAKSDGIDALIDQLAAVVKHKCVFAHCSFEPYHCRVTR